MMRKALGSARFTERGRRVLEVAEGVVHELDHHQIGPKHILFGLVQEREGVAARILSDLGVDPNKVRSDLLATFRGEQSTFLQGEIGLIPRAKKVVELAIDEARRRNHTYVGTEHLLIALLREGEDQAPGVLEQLGVTLDKVLIEVSRG